MSETPHETHGIPPRDEATIAALAEETRTDEAVVQCLYEEEVAELDAHSSVKNFIGVIAARRVRERLSEAYEPGRPAVTDSTRKSQAA